MSQQAVDALFQAMFLLTEIRVLLRETAPGHELDPEQVQRANRLLADLDQACTILRTELIR